MSAYTPEVRYPDAGAVRDDLERYLAGQPTDAEAALARALRQRRKRLAAVVLGVTLLVAGARFASYLFWP